MRGGKPAGPVGKGAAPCRASHWHCASAAAFCFSSASRRRCSSITCCPAWGDGGCHGGHPPSQEEAGSTTDGGRWRAGRGNTEQPPRPHPLPQSPRSSGSGCPGFIARTTGHSRAVWLWLLHRMLSPHGAPNLPGGRPGGMMARWLQLTTQA